MPNVVGFWDSGLTSLGPTCCSESSLGAQRQVGPARRASLTMRAPCRRRPRSWRYGSLAFLAALAALKCIQSLTIRCCLMHSATCSHPWRREVNRKCVVSIDTSILSTSACACERIHNVAAYLLALSGLLILSSLPRESSIA